MTAALLTPAEAAGVYDRRISYIYKLANKHRWKRLTLGGRVYYRQTDIDAVLGHD
jgi:hypothetical protein